MYTVEKKTTTASLRTLGSIVCEGDILQVVYNKFKSTKKHAPEATKYNLIFAHGTGMNKSIWSYHIKKLFERKSDYAIDTVISIDAVGHGDSAVLNAGKIGWICKWDDQTRDILQIIRNEQTTTGDFLPKSGFKTVIIGHSFGAFGAIMAGVVEPNLFDSVVAIEPIIYGTSETVTAFSGRLGKIYTSLRDNFNSLDEATKYFTETHFFRNLHPEVLKDFIADEVYETTEGGQKIARVKATALNQMICYYSATMAIPLGMLVLPTYTIPIVHIAGKASDWNPPGANDFIRGSIPSDVLVRGIDLEGGHLMVHEDPDNSVDAIADHLFQRSLVKDEQLTGDRNSIREEQFGILQKGQFDKVVGFRVLPKF